MEKANITPEIRCQMEEVSHSLLAKYQKGEISFEELLTISLGIGLMRYKDGKIQNLPDGKSNS